MNSRRLIRSPRRRGREAWLVFRARAPSQSSCWSRAAFARRRGMDGERVHAALKLGDKRFVDHAVALEPALPAERLCHYIHPEMSLPAVAMPSMTGLLVGFVVDVQVPGCECLSQVFGNETSLCHDVGITGAGPGSQSGEKRANALVKT